MQSLSAEIDYRSTIGSNVSWHDFFGPFFSSNSHFLIIILGLIPFLFSYFHLLRHKGSRTQRHLLEANY